MKKNVVLCLQLSSTRRSGKTEKERDTYALKMSPKQNEWEFICSQFKKLDITEKQHKITRKGKLWSQNVASATVCRTHSIVYQLANELIQQNQSKKS